MNDLDNIQYVVYGHTHDARSAYFSAFKNSRVRMYINTGTMLPLIRLSRDKSGFSTEHRMTMAYFHKDDEDTSGRKGAGPTLTLWNGIKRKEYNQ